MQNYTNHEKSGHVKHPRQGRNRGGAYGPGGDCLCVKCGEKIPHRKGVKCAREKCPKCGHTMVREEMVN